MRPHFNLLFLQRVFEGLLGIVFEAGNRFRDVLVQLIAFEPGFREYFAEMGLRGLVDEDSPGLDT
jgi:hypothetical protein